MTIYFAHEPSGGFTAGDSDTGHTAYAYWSSVNWQQAKRDPHGVACRMMAQENAYARNARNILDYDLRNWCRLASLVL